MSKISQTIGKVSQIAATIGALGLIAIAVMITIDVAVRWVTGRPIIGVFELSSAALVLATFAPMAMVLFTKQQLRVDIILEFVHGRKAAGLGFLDAAIGVFFFGLLLWIGTDELVKAYNGRFLLPGIIEIPKWIPVFMIWVGTLLSLIVLVYQTIEYFRGMAGYAEVPETINDISEGGL